MRRTAAVLVIAASLLTPFALTAVWLQTQILNTHRYVRTVAPLARNDAVVSAVSDEVTTALLDQLDLGSVAGRSVHHYANRLIEKALRTSAFEGLWVVANTQAHRSLVDELERKPAPVVSADGSIDLDLSNAALIARGALGAAGMHVFDRVQPALLQPRFQIARGSAIGRLRAATRRLKQLSVALPVAVGVLFALAFTLTRDRRRTLRLAGLWLAAAGAAGLVGVVAGRTYYLHDVVGPDVPAAAARAFYDTVLSGLRLWLKVVVLAGLGAFVAAVLAGPSRTAVWARAVTLRTAGGLVDGAAGRSVTAAWVAANRETLRTVVFISGLLILVGAGHPSMRDVLVLAAAVAIGLGAIELLSRPRGVR
jgi:hypothetical protein